MTPASITKRIRHKFGLPIHTRLLTDEPLRDISIAEEAGMIEQQLASMQKPELFGHEKEELQSLTELGIQTLVNLTEHPLFTAELSALNLSIVHFPIVDMSIPALSKAQQLCQIISEQLDQRHCFALHCKAGLGHHTGTLLACVLIYRGMTAMNAIDRLRMINQLYIQTDEQLDFVSHFEYALQTETDAA